MAFFPDESKYDEVMERCGGQCECTGECGRSHRTTRGRCPKLNGTASRLACWSSRASLVGKCGSTAGQLKMLCPGCCRATDRAALLASQSLTTQTPEGLF